MTIQFATFFILVALALDVAAAVTSHIALWQVLLWLCATSSIMAIIAFATHIWISRNQL